MIMSGLIILIKKKLLIRAVKKKKMELFYVQLPKLKCSNISLNHPDYRNYIEFDFKQENLQLYEFISELDDKNIYLAYRNSEIWFQQNLNMDIWIFGKKFGFKLYL